MTQTVKFPQGHKWFGYGFDFGRDRLVSFKRDAGGQALQLRTSYNIHYRTTYHADIRAEAMKYKTAPVQAGTSFVTAALAGLQAGTVINQGLDQIKPSFPYVLFSQKNQCSQYFFAGTSLQEAFDRLAKRGEYVDVKDARILNVLTNTVTTIKAKRITIDTYTL